MNITASEKKDTTFDPVDLAIIGAGMAGLSAAVYARLSGLTVRVFEQHFMAGGLCTSWMRKGYVFDYCIQYFMGNRKGHSFYDIWKELGVIEVFGPGANTHTIAAVIQEAVGGREAA